MSLLISLGQESSLAEAHVGVEGSHARVGGDLVVAADDAVTDTIALAQLLEVADGVEAVFLLEELEALEHATNVARCDALRGENSLLVVANESQRDAQLDDALLAGSVQVFAGLQNVFG